MSLGGLFHGLLALVYVALAWHFWRTRWVGRASDAAPPPGAPQLGQFALWERVALSAAVGAHALLLWSDIFGGAAGLAQARFGFAHALSAMLLVALVVYGVESFFYPLDGMPALVLPAAALCVVLPAVFGGSALFGALSAQMSVQASVPALVVHVGMAMAAYALFTVGAAHAILMAVAERRLHGAQERGAGRASGMTPQALAGLPPLLTMERLLFRIVGAGFVLLTLTLLSGAVFSDALFGRAMKWDHKTVFAWISWGIFAALLAGRLALGWRGRTALKWALAGYAVLLLAYVGSRFVLEVVLQRYA
jgi:ABC-type uncharacterized transport system permease subunit